MNLRSILCSVCAFWVALFLIVTRPAETNPSINTAPPTSISETEEPTITNEPTIEETTETTEPETEPVIFSEDITFTYEWIADDDHMPYALYTPSCADEYDKIPLIVWLHGGGESNATETYFRLNGLPAVLDNWTLEGFNAYIICPQLRQGFGDGRWNSLTSMNCLKKLLDFFIANHNVDTDRIIISGHSLGGQGCLYMAHEMPGYFSACAALSPYDPYLNTKEIAIPIVAYAENASFALGVSHLFEDGVIKIVSTYHGDVPNKVFNLDEDNNNRSDLIEWMLSMKKE